MTQRELSVNNREDFCEENSSLKPKKKKIKIFSLKNFNKLIFSLIIFSFAGYLACANNLSIKGFEMRELRQKRSDIQKENEKMELAVMEIESYKNLDEKVAKIGMVAAGEIEYLGSGVEMVAKR